MTDFGWAGTAENLACFMTSRPISSSAGSAAITFDLNRSV